MTRKRFVTAAASLMMLTPALNKMFAQNARADYKKDFPNNLVAKAENRTINLSAVPIIDIQSESEEMAAEIIREYIDKVATASAELEAIEKKYGANSKAFQNARRETFGMLKNYCLKGQRKYFNMSLADFGMEGVLSLPNTDHNTTFKNNILNSFTGPEYEGCVFIGNIYHDLDALYTARENFINKGIRKAGKISDDAKDALAEKLFNQFNEKNIHISDVTPGSIMGEYSARAPSGIHTQMMFHQGVKVDGKFVPSQADTAAYYKGGFNRNRVNKI